MTLLSAADENLKASKETLEEKIQDLKRLDNELAAVMKANKADLNNLTEAKASLAVLLGIKHMKRYRGEKMI